jgi:hypothetical protein
MQCKEIKQQIFEAVLSGTAPGETAKAHMSGCAACENEYQSMLSTMNVLDTWTAPEPSPYFDVRLRARLREAKEHEPQGLLAHWLEKLGLRRFTWKPVAAAAFALVMAAGVYVEMPNSPVQPKLKTEAACPVVDLQDLDKNQQLLNALQELDEDTPSTPQTQVNE